MENDAPKRRDRLMGKFFGKERAEQRARDRAYTSEQSANDISAFLANSDKLAISHPPPPPPSHGHREYDRQQPTLALDTSRATRYPGALDVNSRLQQHSAYRARSHSPPRRKNKGLVVRFVDSYPEVIGEGGDECQIAVAEIGRRKRSKSAPIAAPIPPTKQGHEYARQIGAFQEVQKKADEGFVPGPIRRSQTGFSTTSEPVADSLPPPPSQLRAVPAGEARTARFLDTSDRKDENRRSFIEVHQQEHRRAEGMALAEAMRSASENSHRDWDDQDQSSSSPEVVQRSPPRVHRKEPPHPNTNDSLPLAYRTQSTRVPQQKQQPLTSPLRSQSQRSQQPPPHMQNNLMPSQAPPAPPKNPARRSPLPPVPTQEPSLKSTANATARSPLPPPPTDEVPELFRDESVRSQRPSPPDELRLNTKLDGSPSSVYSESYSTSDVSHVPTPIMQNPRDRVFGGANSPEKSTRKLQEVMSTPTEEAYDEFVLRTRHLYELFRLHAEQLKPLGTCQPKNMCRAALWWFLRGRATLETAIRSRSADPDDQKTLMARYQAYTDLTKSYWLVELALPEIAEGRFSPVDGETGDARQALKYQLTKLAISMKRNGLLPPEEPFMPQMVDKSIWVEYPTMSQDIVYMLNGNWGSMLASSGPPRSLDALEALPLGDTPQNFNYGRVQVEAYLMEQGMESVQTCFPCMLSINRPTNDPNLVFTLASQNSSISLKIQSDKTAGATWESVRWRTDTFCLQIKMPRGFLLSVQCSQQDFRMLWNIYDFNGKVRAYLYPRQDEAITFRTKLLGFQYFDADPKSRTFPKEPVGQCEVAIYERVLKEGSPTGPRQFHRGFRLAVVTGPKTRTLSGVSHFYPPPMPIQYVYLRGEKREPILQLAFADAKNRCRMALSFGDDGEREKFIALLKGSYIHHDEELVAEVALQGFGMAEGLSDPRGGFPVLQKLPWQLARIVNDRYVGEAAPTVLAEKLRLEITSMDSKGAAVSTVADRINVAPGEFKIRLGAKDILTLQVLRHPQHDMTISVVDKPGLTEAPREFAALQNSVGRSQTVRTYRFNSFKDLHAFQAGLTGFEVLFDGIASSLNISRRRMVVPVYKKWESGTARIQVVRTNKSIQLLAFFEDWHHGQCMGFELKATDIYESAGRNGKATFKLVDAKFPLPKVPEDGHTKTDDMAFVCLDMPEFAGEHDDITIVFEDDGERDRLCQHMPAPVKGSRLSKVGTK